MEERPVHAERRMSDLEAMMWNMEKDPFLSSTFGSLTILDRAPDFDRFFKRMEYVVSTIGRLRQRVVPAFGRLAPPEWGDDPEFDLAFHVRHVGLPPGSDERDLFDLAPLFVQDPFDRTRPLWEFTIIEGLDDGRAALLQKMHHTITDGEGGIRMSERMVDLTREAEDPDPVEIESNPELPTNIFETGLETLTHTVRRGVGVAGRSLDWAGGAIIHPERFVEAGTGARELARSAARQLVVTDGAHSPLWRSRSLNRHFDTLDVDFDDAKRAAKNLGGSLNDFFVAGAARAAGDYHAKKGEPVEDLRMAMPVSFRSDKSAGGNAFAPMRVVVPVQGDPVALFGEIRDLLTETKHEKAIGMISGMAGVLNVLPTSVLVRFTRQQVETIDFTTSNVRAAPFDLYIAGGRIEANYPLGPLSGTAFNLTMMSYRGMLNMGLHVDRGAVEDPGLLRDLLEESYRDLIGAGA